VVDFEVSKKTEQSKTIDLVSGRRIRGGAWSDLYDCDVQEDATEADRDGRGSHDSWTGQEPHGHREPCDAVPTCYDPWLQCHEQTCIQEQ